MRHFFLSLLLLCTVSLCACKKPSASSDDDPAQKPLTADELAQLAGFDHWKVSVLPKSDKPFWGVRVVAFRPDGSLANASTPLQFGTSITTDGNHQILVGLQRTEHGFTGTLMLGTRPQATDLTRFKFSYADGKNGGGQESHIGLVWNNDQAKLVRCVDESQQTTFSINLELLHRQPE